MSDEGKSTGSSKGPVFPAGSVVVERSTGQEGVWGEDGSVHFGNERIPPSGARRMWHGQAIMVAPRRRRGPKPRVPKAPATKRVARERPTGHSAAYERWQEALRGGSASYLAEVGRLTGPVGTQGSTQHVPDCSVSQGSGVPTQADLIACRGCWAEYMATNSRLGALRSCVQAFETYLEERINELLAMERVGWGALELHMRVRRPTVDAPSEWATLRRLYGLLGFQCGRQVTEARALVAEFERVRGAESDDAEDIRLSRARLREAALRGEKLGALFDALERAVGRSEDKVRLLAGSRASEPDPLVQSPRLLAFVAAAVVQRLVEATT